MKLRATKLFKRPPMILGGPSGDSRARIIHKRRPQRLVSIGSSRLHGCSAVEEEEGEKEKLLRLPLLPRLASSMDMVNKARFQEFNDQRWRGVKAIWGCPDI